MKRWKSLDCLIPEMLVCSFLSLSQQKAHPGIFVQCFCVSYVLFLDTPPIHATTKYTQFTGFSGFSLPLMTFIYKIFQRNESEHYKHHLRFTLSEFQLCLSFCVISAEPSHLCVVTQRVPSFDPFYISGVGLGIWLILGLFISSPFLKIVLQGAREQPSILVPAVHSYLLPYIAAHPQGGITRNTPKIPGCLLAHTLAVACKN